MTVRTSDYWRNLLRGPISSDNLTLIILYAITAVPVLLIAGNFGVSGFWLGPIAFLWLLPFAGIRFIAGRARRT